MKKRILSLFLSMALSCGIAVPASAVELDDIKQLLEDHYVSTIPSQILDKESFDDLLAALNDPYTQYYTPEEYDAFLSSINGESIIGIGVSIQTVYEDGFLILETLPNSPAEEAGFQSGDVIIAVDGVPMDVSSDIRAAIAGSEGTHVTITLRRRDTGVTEDFILTRRFVQIPIVTHDLRENICFIDCTSFGQSTAETTLDILQSCDEDVAVWVVDLSENSGGTAQAAASTASLFTGGGILVYFQYGDGSYDYMYAPSTARPITEKPVILQLSPISASGSELMAAAIRDHQAGIAIGQRSFGKGISQTILDHDTYPELFEGDSLKITTARFFSPDAATNHIVGVLPTLVVDLQYADSICTLLSAPAPSCPHGYLKLELAGHTFYIDCEKMRQNKEEAALTELLQALPPNAELYQGITSQWNKIAPQDLAQLWSLDFTARTFCDVTLSPYREKIDTLSVYGLLPQSGDGKFHPDQTITRGEFCQMMAHALNLPVNDHLSFFSDVPADSPYAGGIYSMLTHGFISGHEDGTFHPDTPLTAEAAACILSKTGGWLNMNFSSTTRKELPINQFLEYLDYEDWARDAAWHVSELGITAELLTPDDPVTREEAAAMLYQLMDSLHLLWH